MRLSICIPTFNRAGPLRLLLDSIARQRGHGLEVEVAISDNASEDDTADVVDAFVQAGMRIVYRRLPENRGFDRNMLGAVALASGTWCWLFGSDDVLEDGAFARVEQALARHPGATGISVGTTGYSSDLSRRVPFHDHISADFPRETELHGREAIVKGIGPWGLGYISSIVVRRAAWDAAVATSPVEDYLNGYIHIYVLARALDARSTWVCVPDRLVRNRGSNDQAGSATDPFKRTRLDLVGFDEAFAGALGRRDPAYHASMEKVATFYIRAHFLGAKATGAGARYWRRAIPMSLARYWRYPSFWVGTLPVALIPRPALRVLRAARRRVRPSPDVD